MSFLDPSGPSKLNEVEVKDKSQINCPEPPISASPEREFDGPSETTNCLGKVIMLVLSKETSANAAQ